MDQPASGGKSLPSIKRLFVNSYNQFIQSWKRFFWVLFLPILASLGLVLVIGIIIATVLAASGGDITNARLSLIIPPALVGVLSLIIVGSIGKIALIKTIQNKGQSTINQLIKSAWPLVFRYILLQLLLTLIILVGLALLVIPGLFFIVIFGFATMILVVEGVGGLSALKRSRYYVRNRFWPVVGRMAIPVLGMILISAIFSLFDSAILSILFQLVSTFFFAPVIMIYTFKLYEGLKSSA